MADAPSVASNLINDYEETSIFLDRHNPESIKVFTVTITKVGVSAGGYPINTKTMLATANVGAVKRIGTKIVRQVVPVKTIEDNGFENSGNRLGSVTVFGENQDISQVDSFRQGISVKSLNQFGTKLSPFATINTDKFVNQDGSISHTAKDTNYGQSDLIQKRDKNGKYIPYDDIPGELNPVAFVTAGQYILSYPIVTDRVMEYNKFKNPDTSDGIIEVFNVTRQFANNSIDDINVKGIRCDFVTGDWDFDQKGSAIVDSKFEKEQSNYDYYEDSQDVLIAGNVFKLKQGVPGDTLSNKTFSADGYVSDGSYLISAYNESDLTAEKIHDNIESFLSTNNVLLQTTGSAYSYNRKIQNESSEIGTRYTSANSGFIIQNDCVSEGLSGAKNYFGTDSIAFGGFLK